LAALTFPGSIEQRLQVVALGNAFRNSDALLGQRLLDLRDRHRLVALAAFLLGVRVLVVGRREPCIDDLVALLAKLRFAFSADRVGLVNDLLLSAHGFS